MSSVDLHIGIIGTGKAASALSYYLSENFNIQVYGRNKKSAVKICENNSAKVVNDIADLLGNDIIILAVNDGAIKTISDLLPSYEGLVVHLAGSKPLSLISQKRRAVIWPLLSLNGSKTNFVNAPFFTECTFKEDNVLIDMLIDHLSAKKVSAPLELRQKMHVCAVLNHNFSTHFLHLTEELIGRDNALHLMPLLSNNLQNWKDIPAKNLQTGPAERQDLLTIEEHIKILQNHPEITEIYKLISESIIKKIWHNTSVN